jgi:hypothetical protein
MEKIPPDVLTELKRRGVDSVRSLLTTMSDGHSGTGRTASITLGHVEVARGHMEDWLLQKDAASSRWIKTGAVAAIVAAILAFLSWLFPIK